MAVHQWNRLGSSPEWTCRQCQQTLPVKGFLGHPELAIPCPGPPPVKDSIPSTTSKDDGSVAAATPDSHKSKPKVKREVWKIPKAPKLDEPGKKFDAGKPPMSLLPGEALAEIAQVLEYGAKKYGPHNWRAGMSWSRLLDGVMRHLFAFARGERKDPETGLSHLAHAGAGLLFLLSYEATGNGKDDLYAKAK